MEKQIKRMTMAQMKAEWLREQKHLFDLATRAQKRTWLAKLLTMKCQHDNGVVTRFNALYILPWDEGVGVGLAETSDVNHFDLGYETLLKWLGFSWRKVGL